VRDLEAAHDNPLENQSSITKNQEIEQKNHPPRLYRKVIFMELMAGFEPATSSLPKPW
jgi:hypothetical protein